MNSATFTQESGAIFTSALTQSPDHYEANNTSETFDYALTKVNKSHPRSPVLPERVWSLGKCEAAAGLLPLESERQVCAVRERKKRRTMYFK